MRVIDLKIEDVAFGGKGVAREEGKAVFVPYTIDSEMVSAEIVREKKQFAEAELVEVKESSPKRVRHNVSISANAAGARISTSIISISLPSSGGRRGTRFRESVN